MLAPLRKPPTPPCFGITSNTTQSESSLWPLTDWTRLGHAAEVVGSDADALGQLILKYRLPLEVHLRRKFPTLGNDTDEILHDFSTDKILRQGWLAKANPGKVRLRRDASIGREHTPKGELRGDLITPDW